MLTIARSTHTWKIITSRKRRRRSLVKQNWCTQIFHTYFEEARHCRFPGEWPKSSAVYVEPARFNTHCEHGQPTYFPVARCTRLLCTYTKTDTLIGVTRFANFGHIDRFLCQYVIWTALPSKPRLKAAQRFSIIRSADALNVCNRHTLWCCSSVVIVNGSLFH